MEIEKLLMIPQKDRMDEFVELAGEYGCGFEYNDFFMPNFLDDSEQWNQRIEFYLKDEYRPRFSTVHGAFLDVTVFSDDARIREVSELRVNQSLETAKRLGSEAVIFHTNFVPNFELESYKSNWVERNAAFWTRKLSEYPMLNIYIENMFDTDASMLAALGERMKAQERFGICFDYAHAHVFGDEKEIDTWVKTLAPYVKHLHINDNDYFSDLHLPVGGGKIDWVQFKKYYLQYFRQASVLLEVSGIEKVKQSLTYISQI